MHAGGKKILLAGPINRGQVLEISLVSVGYNRFVFLAKS